MLDIRVLGTAGGIPIPSRYLSSVIINYQGRNILIDAGEGTQVAMREFHTGFRSLDIICLSHFHGDHIFGLPGLLSTLNNSDRVKPVTIIGPTGLKSILDGLLITLQHLRFDIILIEDPKEDLFFTLKDDILQVKEEDDKTSIKISTLELEHSRECIGYSFYVPRNAKFNPEKAIEKDVPEELWSKLQDGKTIEKDGRLYKPSMVLEKERRGIKFSFITDTRPIEDIIAFIRDSDLFICEGTYGDDDNLEKARENDHMTFREAGTLALKAGVGELLITHFSAGLDKPEEYINNAKYVFENTTIAYDGYKTSLNYRD